MVNERLWIACGCFAFEVRPACGYELTLVHTAASAVFYIRIQDIPLRGARLHPRPEFHFEFEMKEGRRRVRSLAAVESFMSNVN